MRCDVSVSEDMAELGQYAKQQLGIVDFWINNAGQVTRKRLLADVHASDISSAVGESAALWKGPACSVQAECNALGRRRRLHCHGTLALHHALGAWCNVAGQTAHIPINLSSLRAHSAPCMAVMMSVLHRADVPGMMQGRMSWAACWAAGRPSA